MGKDNLKIHTFFGKKFPPSRAYFRPVSRFSWILPINGSHKVWGGGLPAQIFTVVTE